MSATEDKNGRTHEPNLRELTSQLDGFKELIDTRFVYVEKVMDERHQLYKERADAQKVAVEDALLAAKEQTNASFQASEKAIVKAEESQKAYNVGHNDLSRKMEAQYALMVPSTEAKLKWDSVDKAIDENRKEIAAVRTDKQEQVNSLRIELMKEIGGLRESRSQNYGKDEAQNFGTQKQQFNLTTIVAILALIAAIVAIFKH